MGAVVLGGSVSDRSTYLGLGTKLSNSCSQVMASMERPLFHGETALTSILEIRSTLALNYLALVRGLALCLAMARLLPLLSTSREAP
jgi:hypothetical protein